MMRCGCSYALTSSTCSITPTSSFYNSNDVLNVMPPSTDPNCHECLNAFTGEFVGADGHILHLGDLQHGRTSTDWLDPRFRGLGMPAAADKPRQIQLSLAIR